MSDDFSNGQPLTQEDIQGKPAKANKAKPKAAVAATKKQKPKQVKAKVKDVKKAKPRKAAKPKVRTVQRSLMTLGQLRILRALTAKPNIALEQKVIAKRAGLTDGWTFNHLGAVDPANRQGCRERIGGAQPKEPKEVRARKARPTLFDLKAITTKHVPIDTKTGSNGKRRVYAVTATGRSLLEKAEAELAAKKAAKKKGK